MQNSSIVAVPGQIFALQQHYARKLVDHEEDNQQDGSKDVAKSAHGKGKRNDTGTDYRFDDNGNRHKCI